MEQYKDCNRLSFADYRNWLPRSVAASWPAAERVKEKDALREFAERWDHCQLCGVTPPGTPLNRLHVHHIIGGMKGRSDEDTNLMRLCSDCHERIQGNSTMLPVLLWAKWRTEKDDPTIDWVRLTVLRRQHLPTPMPSARWLDEYEANRRRNHR